jgi:Eco57I restriction-modification methylase/N-6 DNA Methylase
MARVAIIVEGGLIGSDLIEQIAATPQDVAGQRPVDFGLDARLSDEIQKAFSDGLIHWHAFNARVARSKESPTTITRETWVLPLLEELGFTLTFQRAAATAGGGSFMLSHRLGADPSAPPVHIVASEQELDRKGDAARSPHALVQDYLNRSDALWGIVTNGRKLRLLRNTVRFSKPSFIEFDLKAICDGNLYSEFVLFYRLVHATRLPRGAGEAHECWLEKYYQQGIEQGGRVRERLRIGVHQVLEILGTGLLAHADSGSLREKFASGHIDKVEFYRQLLRLIYRLLFLMVAEERRLLFVPDSSIADRQEVYDRWYSIERLRKRADHRLFEDSHGDLWEGLKQTFRLFEDTPHAAQLGLTALDGELFGRFACGDLIDAHGQPGPKLRNDRLLAAIWQLSTFEDSGGRRKSGVRRRVNFAGLDVEELGSVYESLLDYHPKITIAGDRSKFELIAGTERKSTGSYYTPPELVRELIKSALEPVIENRLARASTRDEKERALLSLKVCDPASGSGHFMLAAARRIGRELARVRSGEAEPNPADYRHAVRDVIRRCIYAVDKNPLAVDLCKVALWIEGHEPGLPLSFLDHHIKCGDALIGVIDLDVLRAGVPDDAYKPVAGDDKPTATEIKKRNRADAKALFRYNIQDTIDRIAGAFAGIADLLETTPYEVRAKEGAYARLRQGEQWERAKWACDLWTACFFAQLIENSVNVVPTTRQVWDAISGVPPRGRTAGLTKEVAASESFFHWPLEFPEVFASGGFDVILGNPPWDVSEFRAAEWPKEQQVIGKTLVARRNRFYSGAGRLLLCKGGKLNLYAGFVETILAVISKVGYSGIVVPLAFVTDETTSRLFREIVKRRRLGKVLAFENEELIFPGIHHASKFCLTVIGPNQFDISEFLIFARRLDHLADLRRRYTLSNDETHQFNPNSGTAPLFRSVADKQLAMKIYRDNPILAKWTKYGPGLDTRRGFYNISTQKSLFVEFRDDLEWGDADHSEFTPLYEGKMIQAFNHRFGTYNGQTDAQRRQGVLPQVSDKNLADSEFRSHPRYLVSSARALEKYEEEAWKKSWALGWRDITSNVSERTAIACILPKYAFEYGVFLLLGAYDAKAACYLVSLFNSLVFDYVVRQKFAGSHLKPFFLFQCPAPDISDREAAELTFIETRALELSCATKELAPFAEEVLGKREIYHWDPERRVLLRAELDAFYAYLYGLTRRELEYILEPKVVMGADYPSETFRVLKDNEERDSSIREYRTGRLVLEAWDRFVVDGTFDPARLREPQYIDRVAQELTATRTKLEQVEHDSKALLALATATAQPTLFVEGVTDAKILEAAWTVFFPDERMPVKVIPAGGTKEMGSLAGKGKALREILGDRVVLVLADNDSAGRHLTDDGHVRKGGTWRQLPNGIHWYLLKPTASFAAAMKAHNVPPDYWPFTIEAAFAPALRRQAEAAAAWRFSGSPQAELLDNPDLARRLFSLVPKLGPGDDAYWYLMAPDPATKEAFAAWITDTKQRTEENYAAFEELIRGLRALVGLGERAAATDHVRGAA